jgi:hypothetical protein
MELALVLELPLLMPPAMYWPFIMSCYCLDIIEDLLTGEFVFEWYTVFGMLYPLFEYGFYP